MTDTAYLSQPTDDRPGVGLFLQALALSLGPAIALGLARFSYALLLPPMKAGLGWTFADAGTLNTGIGVGYLIGALAYPFAARRVPADRLFLGGCVVISLAMAMPGLAYDYHALLVQRILCGVCSAAVFVGGGILASRLATAHARHSGLVLGLYYGGVGSGIVLSALVVPAALGAGGHGWRAAWIGLALTSAVCTTLAWPVAARMGADRAKPAAALTHRRRRCAAMPCCWRPTSSTASATSAT